MFFAGIFLLFGCNNYKNIYDCRGIPDVNQGFTYMYFKNAQEGFLFGTFSQLQKRSEKEYQNPNFIPQLSKWIFCFFYIKYL